MNAIFNFSILNNRIRMDRRLISHVHTHTLTTTYIQLERNEYEMVTTDVEKRYEKDIVE